MMKLVLVNGSPHGSRGGTARIGEWVLAPIREAGAEIVRFDLSELNIRFCNGCGQCMRSGTCAIDDDVPKIYAAWQDANIILFECPTHVFQITGLMKTFIDRLAGELHRPSLMGTYAGIVSSSAGMGESEVIAYLGNSLEILGAAFVGAVWGTYRPPTRLWEPEGVQSRAERLGLELLEAVDERRVYPTRDHVLSQRRFLRELIQRNRKLFKADYAYWKEKDWFDPKADQE